MTQEPNGDGQAFSARLRQVRDNNNLTTQEMAQMTGIPKRTLESYMLKSNSSLPGLQAVQKLAVGLGVSLDWIVFGGQTVGEDTGRLVRLAARAASLPILNTLLAESAKSGRDVFANGKILGLSAEELAAEIGADAGDRARALAKDGMRRVNLTQAERVLDSRYIQNRTE